MVLIPPQRGLAIRRQLKERFDAGVESLGQAEGQYGGGNENAVLHRIDGLPANADPFRELCLGQPGGCAHFLEFCQQLFVHLRSLQRDEGVQGRHHAHHQNQVRGLDALNRHQQ